MADWGPSIKYVTLFLANFDPPSLCHTLLHIPGPPFLVGLVQKPGQKTPVQILSIVRGGLVRRFCQFVFSLEGFVRGGFCPFPLLSEYICYNSKLNITLNFRFHMNDQKRISVTSCKNMHNTFHLHGFSILSYFL